MSLYTETLTEHLPLKLYRTDMVVLTEMLAIRACVKVDSAT